MIKFSTVLKTEFDEAKRRLIQVLGMGKGDVQTPFEAMSYGDDSSPIEGIAALHVNTGMNGETAIVGYINLNQLAKPGEKRFYSTNESGTEQTSIWMKDDGKILIGEDADEAAMMGNKFDNEWGKLMDAIGAIVVPTAMGPSGIPVNKPSFDALKAAFKAAVLSDRTFFKQFKI